MYAVQVLPSQLTNLRFSSRPMMRTLQDNRWISVRIERRIVEGFFRLGLIIHFHRRRVRRF